MQLNLRTNELFFGQKSLFVWNTYCACNNRQIGVQITTFKRGVKAVMKGLNWLTTEREALGAASLFHYFL